MVLLRKGSNYVAIPCRAVRLQPAPPNFSYEINKIAPQEAFCCVRVVADVKLIIPTDFD